MHTFSGRVATGSIVAPPFAYHILAIGNIPPHINLAEVELLFETTRDTPHFHSFPCTVVRLTMPQLHPMALPYSPAPVRSTKVNALQVLTAKLTGKSDRDLLTPSSRVNNPECEDLFFRGQYKAPFA